MIPQNCSASTIECYAKSTRRRLMLVFVLAWTHMAISKPMSFAAVSASFHGLGGIAPTVGAGQETKSGAVGVSGDGFTIVGVEGIRGPARWVGLAGPISLRTVPDDYAFGVARNVSYDGSVIVGTLLGKVNAFRWTSATGLTELGDPPEGMRLVEARGVSGDGRVIVGSISSASGREVYRWTAESGIVNLGSLNGDDAFAVAQGASYDGSVIVGQSLSERGIEPFRWTPNTGMVGLGTLPGGNFNSSAFDVSADGTVIVGYSYLQGANSHAFRWTQATGMVDLGDLPGGADESLARSVSDNGNVIVGASASSNGLEAFIWTPNLGMRSLRSLLTQDFRLTLDGWTLTDAWGVSANGSVIVGTGINPDGFHEGWR